MTDQEKYDWSCEEDFKLLWKFKHDSLNSKDAGKELLRRLAMLDSLLNHDHEDSGECSGCGEIVCPFGEQLHFHHDGCPACAQFEKNL